MPAAAFQAALSPHARVFARSGCRLKAGCSLDWLRHFVAPTIRLMAKKESSAKTNAARMLDAAGISYELREYAVDEEDLSAPSVAAKIGMPPEQVFKTLVARGDRSGVLMACIPANA